MTLTKKLLNMGYTEEELDKDNPYTQYITTSEEDEVFNSMKGITMSAVQNRRFIDGLEVTESDFMAFEEAKTATGIDSMQITSSRNPLVIYHGNCADGFSAAWVFHHIRHLVETKFDFHAGIYGEPLPDVDDRIVYVVDFSYKPPIMRQLLQRATKVFWIDHHKTAIEELLTEANIVGSPKFKYLVNVEKSGATLAWEFWEDILKHLMGPMPKLLSHVEDRDLWRFRLPFTREIQAAVFAYEYTFENWDIMMGKAEASEESELKRLRDAGIMLERKHHKDIAELVKVCMRFMTIAGHTVPVASLPYTLTSDAGHLMAKEWVGGAFFAACYWDTVEHRNFSLRSTEYGMDVSKIAQQYGGGGHRHAAGFKVLRSHKLAMA